MITLQMTKGTGPYNQMQRYIADVHKDLTPQQRAGKFTALLKKYVQECNTFYPHHDFVTRRIVESFSWKDSKDGWDFWEKVESYSTQPLEVKKKQPVVKPPIVAEQPKPAAPALVWPKGFYHFDKEFNHFLNEEGRINNGALQKWMHKDTFGRRILKASIIKRPETPLPNGLQWLEGYTHANSHEGTWFQFNDEHYVWNGEVKPWGEFGRKREWFEKRTTIQRYPDNQPLILDVPPQAPVRPVGRRGDQPVPQAPVVENVAVKAPVEPPKVPPVAKKQVGWWK